MSMRPYTIRLSEEQVQTLTHDGNIPLANAIRHFADNQGGGADSAPAATKVEQSSITITITLTTK